MNTNNDNIVCIERSTLETQIKLKLDFRKDAPHKLDGTSGVGFFDHMLNSFAVHSGIGMTLEMTGDLHVDCHHSIEDVGIVLGQALRQKVQCSKGYKRYGCAYIPMDEALVRSVIDISGRPYLNMDYTPKSNMIGDFDTQMTLEFFRAVAFNMGATLHISVLSGQNDHHIVEAIFKAFAHSLADAMTVSELGILSAKGVL